MNMHSSLHRCRFSSAQRVTLALREYIEHLKRTLRRAAHSGMGSEGVVRKYTDGRGSRRVQGGPLLKATQVYTAQFGDAVAALHKKRSLLEFLGQGPRKILASDMPEVDVASLPLWHDAKLEPVERYMKRRRMRSRAAA